MKDRHMFSQLCVHFIHFVQGMLQKLEALKTTDSQTDMATPIRLWFVFAYLKLFVTQLPDVSRLLIFLTATHFLFAQRAGYSGRKGQLNLP
jgi:hypothetical protein